MKKLSLFLLFFLVLAVNGWASCTTGPCTGSNGRNPTLKCAGANVSQSGTVSIGGTYDCKVNWVGTSSTNYAVSVTNRGSWCGDSTYVNNVSLNIISCTTKAEADSVNCVNEGKDWVGGVCKEIPTTTYHCQNRGGSGSASNLGIPQQADFYECTGDVCTLTKTLAGTCQQWGVCPDGVSDCDITDSTGRVPCTLSGNGTSTNGRCYYQCGNGKSYNCPSTYSTWGGSGDVYVGQCDPYPSEACAPDLRADTTQRKNPYDSSGIVIVTPSDSIPSKTYDPSESGEIDYSLILKAIHDTLHIANNIGRSQAWSLSNIDSLLDYSVDFIQNISSVENKNFTLVGEVSRDLDSSRQLLSEIKDLMRDTLNVRVSGVSGDSTGVPVYNDSSWFQKIFNWASGALSSSNDSSFTAVDCRALLVASNKCIADGGSPLDCRLEWQQKCGNDISPVETMVDGSLTLLSRIFDYMSNGPEEPDTTYSVDSSAVERVKDLLSRFDSIPGFDLDSLKATLQAKIDSAQNKRDSVQMKPDSLFMDTSSIRKKFQGSGIFLPGGTNNTCYVCRAELGTFGGLSDTSLAINIDFSDFGGYDWCELGRTVIRIATLVVVISLTLGSFAAAFGWNRSTGEG